MKWCCLWLSLRKQKESQTEINLSLTTILLHLYSRKGHVWKSWLSHVIILHWVFMQPGIKLSLIARGLYNLLLSLLKRELENCLPNTGELSRLNKASTKLFPPQASKLLGSFRITVRPKRQESTKLGHKTRKALNIWIQE